MEHPGRPDGEPRSCDVVPPPVPRRRVVAVRPASDIDCGSTWPRRRCHLPSRRHARRHRRARRPGETRPMTRLGRVLASIGIAIVATTSCSDDSKTTPTAPIASTTAPASVESSTTSTSGTSVDTAPRSSAPASAPAETTTVAPTTTVLRPTSSTPQDPAAVAFQEIADVSGAVDITNRSGDPAYFIVSREGFIVAMRDGTVDQTRLLDISGDIRSGGEQGLLGLTFSRDGSHAYIDYTNGDGDTEITEYAVGADGLFDPTTKRVLLTIDQPFSNHNGGQVRIGPDGYLYIGTGDGGSQGDPQRRGLDVGDLLGKILRIDPTPVGDSPYSVPPDNPYVGVDGARTELWSIGLRNPWRYTFDLATNDLWIADVGQGAWEEIDVAWADQGAGRGANFGWSAFEGTHRYNEDQSGDGTIAPIYEYPHGARGCSVSGGVRYRGTSLPNLYGWYVYGDYCSGEVTALEIKDDRTVGQVVTLTSDLNGVSEIAQGPDGELFALNVDSGKVYAIQPAGQPGG